MDRNRFKTKSSEEVARPPVRPVAQPARDIAAPIQRPHAAHKPVHHRPQPAPQPSHAEPKPIQQSHHRPVAQSAATPAMAPEPPVAAPPKPAEYKKLSKRKIAEIALGLAILVGVIGAIFTYSKADKPDLKNATASAASGLHVTSNGAAANSKASVSGTVPFTPVVPKDKPQLAKLGSSAYNAQYKSYTFDDTLQGQKVRVSEQELPSGQTSAAGLIDKISASLKPQSVEPFTPANGQPAYLLNATSQAGAQVVIFTAQDMLFFVQSGTTYDAATWTNYINNFQ